MRDFALSVSNRMTAFGAKLPFEVSQNSGKGLGCSGVFFASARGTGDTFGGFTTGRVQDADERTAEFSVGGQMYDLPFC
jgi:hypothetical protein